MLYNIQLFLVLFAASGTSQIGMLMKQHKGEGRMLTIVKGDSLNRLNSQRELSRFMNIWLIAFIFCWGFGKSIFPTSKPVLPPSTVRRFWKTVCKAPNKKWCCCQREWWYVNYCLKIICNKWNKSHHLTPKHTNSLLFRAIYCDLISCY